MLSSRELGAQAWARLAAGDRDWLTELTAMAPAGARLALVGGAVRDALLGQTPQDLDIAVDAPEVGNAVETLARASGLPYTFHPAFHNATLTLPDGRGADLVRTRRESYPVWGANPVPQAGRLADDLRRRDFGLNALALVLAPGEPALLDVVGGVEDLRERWLRPLHADSLAEDASRLVRGARLAARLGLRAAPELLAQVSAALTQAPTTPRLWAELRLLLAEPRPLRAAEQLRQWGAGEWLPPAPLWERLDARPGPPTPLLYAAALLATAPDPPALAGRLGLGHRPLALLGRAESDKFYPPGTPEATLREVLRPGQYAPLSGKDLLALGFAPGPELGRALAHLAELRRSGQVNSTADERQALRDYANTQSREGEQPIE